MVGCPDDADVRAPQYPDGGTTEVSAQLQPSVPARLPEHVPSAAKNCTEEKVKPQVRDFDKFLEYAEKQAQEAVESFQAGNIKKHIKFWRSLTSDTGILGLIAGVTLEFDSLPVQKFVPKPYKFPREKKLKIDEQIVAMLHKGIIERAEHSPGEFISNIFTRDKSDGGLRVILDLTELNKYIVYRHFKMDTFLSALDLVYPECYMASIDWKDAYFSVPIKTEDRKFLRFYWGSQLLQFTCLPNGLASAPRIFSKITKVFFAELRKKGHANCSYIDDSFLVGDEIGCKENVCDTFEASEEAGWVTHPIKSRLRPAQRRTFLGFVINSVLMIVTLTDERIQKMIQVFQSVLRGKNNVTIRCLAEAIGLMVASFPAVEFGPLFYRRSDNFKTEALKAHAGNYDARVAIPGGVCEDLHWWEHNTPTAYAPIRRKSPEVVLTSDASHIGWGGSCGGKKTGGNWSASEREKHINVLEIKAALFTVQAFCTEMFDKHLLIRIDNTTAVVYINQMGGRKETCNMIARELWLWCRARRLFITASYIPGAQNVVADTESRLYHENGEWSLHQTLFQNLCDIWGKPQLDLFASRLNFKITPYFSWRPDPGCEAVDAFSTSWENSFVYAFPPFCLIGKVLKKIENDGAKGLIIFPLWPTQPWFATISRLLIDSPILLSSTKGDIITHPSMEFKTHLPKLRLVAALVGNEFIPSKSSKDWLRQLLTPHGELVLKNNTKLTSRSGTNFVRNGEKIPWLQMNI